jgi:hypothetical protein
MIAYLRLFPSSLLRVEKAWERGQERAATMADM